LLELAIELAALSSHSLSESIRQSTRSGFSMMTRLVFGNFELFQDLAAASPLQVNPLRN
jgi:hypothetical protein